MGCRRCWFIGTVLLAAGCAGPQSFSVSLTDDPAENTYWQSATEDSSQSPVMSADQIHAEQAEPNARASTLPADDTTAADTPNAVDTPAVEPTATAADEVGEESQSEPSDTEAANSTPQPDASAAPVLDLQTVISSVSQNYPLLQQAVLIREIARGEQLAAAGEFDVKLKGSSENSATGYYQTHRQSLGVNAPIYSGGEAFAGYRVGRGDFQPWYLERQTNDGGEFKAGISLPLLQNVDVDARRSALWSAQYGQQLAEPQIQAQLIQFVREASYAYWQWVAAGESFHIAERILLLAEERSSRIKSQVDAGLIDPPELTDNLRLIAERKSRLADSRRKLDQSAAKLSLFLRNERGEPSVPTIAILPDLPQPAGDRHDPAATPAEIQMALQQRPELRAIALEQTMLRVEYSQAENLTLPSLDAVLAASQDIGAPSSSKRDKSRFELEAGLFLEVPVQRRKARGKMAVLQGKMAQVAAKQRMVSDKITVEVQSADIALEAAFLQVQQSREAVRLAEDLASRERENLEAGLSDLLKVTLREQYAAESAQKLVDALLLFHQAKADLRAALGYDSLPADDNRQ
jgi:outer membrane protein TolC